MKRLLFLCSLAALALTAASATQRAEESQGATLPEKARMLKQMGIEEAEPSVDLVDYGEPANMDDLLSAADTIVSAHCLDKRYRLSEDARSIQTLYRCRVESTLKGRLPRNKRAVLSRTWGNSVKFEPDEIIVWRRGGVLYIDGVKFVEEEGGHPPYVEGERYLLFLRGVNLGELNALVPVAGPSGCFSLKAEAGSTRLKAFSCHLQQDLDSRFNSQLSRLADYVQAKVAN